MARPKSSDPRSHKATVRFTLGELEEARANADSVLLPLGTYLRLSALRRPTGHRVNNAAFVELRRIGVNLNQIARVANTERRQDLRDRHLQATLEKIREVAEKLVQ